MTAGVVEQVQLTDGITTWDVSEWVDRSEYEPPAADLRGQITQATVRLIDSDGAMPVTPREGMEILLRDSVPALVFGGWVMDPKADAPAPIVPAWTLTAQSWAARMAEKPTGSFNKSGIRDTDRNFVIGMFRDALAAASNLFGTDTTGVDDPIIVANEAVGWSGVQPTTFLYGTDWSYRTLLDVIQDLLGRVPGVSIRIRADKIVEYGIFATPASFVLASYPSAAQIETFDPTKLAIIEAGSYEEEVLAAGHVNKVRLGGAGAAEVTAYDQVSFGRYRRVMEAPYENLEEIPAGDPLTQAAYAKLATFAERRVARARTDREGIEPGVLVGVGVDNLGCIGDEGWIPDIYGSIFFGTPTQEPAAGWRGELIVQKVTPTFVGPGRQMYDLELGAYVPDLERALAEKIGGSVGG